ncbi:hypothetical protein [Winogradskya humida]|uniref:Uncharacterized protein n=1 Tax=Winogradskya humida TaxID=113566 RepID=A0ABQ3ZUA2_9ACTN|nr:hypothetical protein [Actinoplanes humidus]GIE22153.1 hypothetical protein Ahu01nite_052550 [Actinoplanes humidus]
MNSEGGPPNGDVDAALGLTRALRQGIDLLGLNPEVTSELLDHLHAAELSITDEDRSMLIDHIKAIRYILLEMADGPLAPFLADAAAVIIGDGFGRLFS